MFEFTFFIEREREKK